MRSIHRVTNVPVIFLSGYAPNQVIARAFELGVDDYIVKPFSPTDVKGVDKTYQWGGAKMYHQRGHWPA